MLGFKDCHGYQVDANPASGLRNALAPNGELYCYGKIFYSATGAEAIMLGVD